MNDGVYLAYDYPVLGAFWTAMWVFIWVLWLVLLFRIIADIFRDDDMGGLAKTVWLLVVIFLPYIGVFAYVIARGRGMGSREHRHAKDQQHAFETYIRETAAWKRRPDPGGADLEALRGPGTRRHLGRGVPAGQGEDPRLTALPSRRRARHTCRARRRAAYRSCAA